MKRGIAASLVVVAACGGAATHAPPDAAMRPSGAGWFCHRETRGSDCVRSEQQCIDASSQNAGSACNYLKYATCMTMKRAKTGAGVARCFDSAEECERVRDMTASDLDDWYDDVSECGRWP